VLKNGKTVFELPSGEDNADFLVSLYRAAGIDYRKFFKMDNLSRLGFLASEILLAGNAEEETAGGNMSVIFFNSSSSLDIDTVYQGSIRDADNYYPSPSEFVYTLPNIVTGEIAIRRRTHGETAFFISETFDYGMLCERVSASFDDTSQKSLCGWVEYCRGKCEAILFLVTGEPDAKMLFNPENVRRLATDNE
jgi:hypothetical protein